MKVTFDIMDEKQIKQIEALRGEKAAEEFAALCFAQGLNLMEFQHRQIITAAKHPLLQFPEAKTEFKSLDAPSVSAVLKEGNPVNPVAVEVTRLVAAYIAQLNEYARQNGNRLPAHLPASVHTPVEEAAFRIATDAIKKAVQKGGKTAAAA